LSSLKETDVEYQVINIDNVQSKKPINLVVFPALVKRGVILAYGHDILKFLLQST